VNFPHEWVETVVLICETAKHSDAGWQSRFHIVARWGSPRIETHELDALKQSSSCFRDYPLTGEGYLARLPA
jgi:hypothetical protein